MRRGRMGPVWLTVGILLAAGIMALSCAFHMAGWTSAERTGEVVYLVPGSPGSWVAARIVPILTLLGGGAIVFATMLLLTAWLLAAGLAPPRHSGATASPAPRRRRLSFARIGPVLLVVVLMTFPVRWYAYVSNINDPFDEVGIALNNRAPAPARDWGCARLKATFGTKTLPPFGCGRSDAPGQWR